MTLEICANSIASALAAQQGGADRIELCDNLEEGGTTPSYGTIKKARESLSIAIYPLIRPRGGDFIYSEEEFAVMQADIELCKQLGCEGVVIGLLNEKGEIDKGRTRQLVQAAYPLGVTFHRAFDRCTDPFQALEDSIACGCERILTSGQEKSALEGKDLLKKLIQKSKNRISIMPGAGITSENIAELAQATGATEFHTTAKTRQKEKVKFSSPLAQKEDLSIQVTDERTVSALKKALSRLQKG